jgi:type VI secretion system protein ImpA
MISCREDVVRLIEKICEYYQQHEPSSPLPLLLQRCKRLVAANFLDIIRDLAPDAVAKMEGLRGKDN